MFLRSSETFPLYLSWDRRGRGTGTVCGFTADGGTCLRVHYRGALLDMRNAVSLILRGR